LKLAHGWRSSVRCHGGVTAGALDTARSTSVTMAPRGRGFNAAGFRLSRGAGAALGWGVRRGLLAVLVLALAPLARAHPLGPSVLEIRETGGGRAEVGWKTPLLRPRGADLEPVLPDRCRAVGPRTVSEEGGGVWTRWAVDCGTGGLVGERVGIAGPGSLALGALVRVTLADGRLVQGVVSPAHPMLTVPPRPCALDLAQDYVRLGVAHILVGPDHLLFVFGLVLLAGTARRLLATVSAFTAGHSVTLTLAAVGIVDFPSRLIEVAIAASVLALAVELARRPTVPTLIRRRPWAMAGAFGLLHGLGFAAALREAGLPSGEVPLALLSFNVGIEVGQVLFVVGVLALGHVAGRIPVRVPTWARRVPVYGMGSLAGYWWLERTIALFR
jgi:hydrogenase/urease accessory protein HupE